MKKYIIPSAIYGVAAALTTSAAVTSFEARNLALFLLSVVVAGAAFCCSVFYAAVAAQKHEKQNQ